MSLKGTKTEANLMAAFAGESQARNKYTYYAAIKLASVFVPFKLIRTFLLKHNFNYLITST